jgi:putative FmdB family regulatory protein
MPLYEYACEKCDRTFEALVFDGESVSCPHCEGEKVERLLSVPAKPLQNTAELPMSCNPKLPPCGPGCCRLP